jgi:DNA-binding MarR family transcriptional regulator
VPNHELHEHRILTQLESGQPITQRRLAQELGIALGLTNLLVRRLVQKGWVRVSHVKASRIRYLITPAGIAAKARLTRAYVRQSIRYYRETRDRMREELARLSGELPAGNGAAQIVFYGAGEAAEIAYVCLQETTLELVAVVDPTSSRPLFFNMRVCGPADLDGDTVAGRSFVRVVVMPVENEEDVRTVLADRGVRPESVFWL